MKKLLAIAAMVLIPMISFGQSLYDRSGSYKGKVESNGSIYDRSGSYIGKVDRGSFYDRTGSYIGKTDGKSFYDAVGRTSAGLKATEECMTAVGRT